MEQKDYLLREIEKMGLLLRQLLNALTGNTGNSAISALQQVEETNEQLISEIGLDLNRILALHNSELLPYINQLKGIDNQNRELLADILYQQGVSNNGNRRKDYLEKSLHLYEYCRLADKTYSIDREFKIELVKRMLSE